MLRTFTVDHNGVTVAGLACITPPERDTGWPGSLELEELRVGRLHLFGQDLDILGEAKLLNLDGLKERLWDELGPK